MEHKEFMKLAIDEAFYNHDNDYQEGGPFGAVIVKDGEVIAKSHNMVLKNHDATAHAEVNAIREASKVLNTHDLSNCILYASSEPCPMCLSAIIWANIKEIYFANTKEDTAKIGFRDDMIYDYLKGKTNILNIRRIDIEEASKVYEDFLSNNNKEIY